MWCVYDLIKKNVIATFESREPALVYCRTHPGTGYKKNIAA